MEAFKFKTPINVYYRGIMGTNENPYDDKAWEKKEMLLTKEPVRDSLALFQILNLLPTMEEVQDGFTYFFFTHDRTPDWDRNLSSSAIDACFEVLDSYAKFNEEGWKELKAKLEAVVHELILIFVGNSLKQFEKVFGIMAKVRRSRITISLWYDEEPADTKPELRDIIEELLQKAAVNLDPTQYSIEIINEKLQKQSEESKSRNSSRSSSRRKSQSRNGSEKRESDRK